MIHTRLNEWHPEPRSLCGIDPITLTGLALAGAGGLAASSAMGGGTPPSPAAPPPQAAPQQAPQGKDLPRPQNPTFIGAAATPPPSSGGGKTLLGQ